MAFRPQSLSPAPPETPTPSRNQSSSSAGTPVEDLWPSQVLHPQAPPESTPAKVSEQRQRTARWINGLKILGPCLNRIWTSGESPEQQAVAFQNHLTAAADLAQSWATKLSMEDGAHTDFTQGVLAVILESGVDLQPWQDNGLAWSRLLDQANAGLVPQGTSPTPTSEHLMVHLALLRGLGHVLAAQQHYDLARSAARDQDMVLATEWLVSQSTQHLARWADASLPMEERRTLFGVLVDQAGRLLAHAWQQASQRTQEILRSKSAKEIEAWRRQHPEGFPLAPVFQAAQEAFDRLVRLTLAVQPPRRRS